MAEEKAFVGVGQNPGLSIWRIENFQVVPYDKNSYGKFYSGDSYVVLHTKKVGQRLDWDIHFWLGKNTSQDEAGTAAIKAVQLDDALGGVPVQHREVQEHETKLFLSYFKSGIRYLDGGVASGFAHVDPNKVEKRLLHVKGKRQVRVRQVDLNVNSMNKGDCFILDAGPHIYVFVGQQAGRMERVKAVHAANNVRDQDHAGRSKIHILDETATPAEYQAFFAELGSGSMADVKSADKGGEDLEHEVKEQVKVTLHRLSDASGKLKTEQVAARPLKHEHLDSNDCFILDGGAAGIFVWIGKKCSQNEKQKAMKTGIDYLKFREYPTWTQIIRVVDGGEPVAFKQYFSSWKEPEENLAFERVYTKEQIAAAKPVEEGVDIKSLHREKRRLLAKSGGKAFGFMPDDGSGKIEIWRIENFELAPVQPSLYGHFFGGDSYVLRYTYGNNKYIIYYWQGLESTQDERACSALWAVKLDNEVGGRAVQVRVIQGYEPKHFLTIFKGKMIIFSGGRASGFKNRHDGDSYDVDGTRLFHIRGTCPEDVRAVQVPEVAKSLKSDDVFVLETPASTYIWFGKGSSNEEKELGKNITGIVSPGRKPVIVEEGQEPAGFWSAIGGKGPYDKSIHLPGGPLLSPRLFHCSDETGRFKVEEIGEFTQEDLDEDDVMVLDTGAEVYIWLGKDANEAERAKSLKLAEDYIRTDPTDRKVDDTVMITVKQGEEPAGFTSIFSSWNHNLWTSLSTYEDLKKSIAAANAVF